MDGRVVGEDAMGPSDPYLLLQWPGGSKSTDFHKDTYFPDFNQDS